MGAKRFGMVEKMKKSMVWLSVIMIMAVLCTSCGTKLQEAGDYMEAGSVSGSVVSGSAVSDSVSGSAVSNRVRERTDTVKKQSINDKYPYCNDKNLYREGRKNKIVQCRLDGTVVREYRVKAEDEDEWYIAYVNNEELFYVSYGDEKARKESAELWWIPIDKRKDGDHLQTDKAEKILSNESGFSRLYANEDYIIYSGELDTYKEYDRKKKKFLTVDREGEDNSYKSLSRTSDIGGSFGRMAGDTVFLKKLENGNWAVGPRGLYAHKLGTGTVTRIKSWYEGNSYQKQSRYYMRIATVEGNKFYYDLPETNEENVDEDFVELNIWVYDIETKENKKFISSEQLAQQCDGKKPAIYLSSHIVGNKMYILFMAIMENSDRGDSVTWTVFSKDLDGNAEVQHEKKLSEFLDHMNYKDDEGENILGVNSNSYDFIEGKMIFEYGPSEKKGCYDLSDGTFKDVKKGDAEAAYWDYRDVLKY